MSGTISQTRMEVQLRTSLIPTTEKPPVEHTWSVPRIHVGIHNVVDTGLNLHVQTVTSLPFKFVRAWTTVNDRCDLPYKIYTASPFLTRWYVMGLFANTTRHGTPSLTRWYVLGLFANSTPNVELPPVRPSGVTPRSSVRPEVPPPPGPPPHFSISILICTRICYRPPCHPPPPPPPSTRTHIINALQWRLCSMPALARTFSPRRAGSLSPSRPPPPCPVCGAMWAWLHLTPPAPRSHALALGGDLFSLSLVLHS